MSESPASEAPRISLIVPAFNEAILLPRLLETVDVARSTYRHGRDTVEVIVADNGSTDGTAAVATARGCRVASISTRVIAAARNGGAALGRAPVLAFVDADMQVHPETFNVIDAALADPRAIAGATGIVPERWSPGIAFCYYCLFLPPVWMTGFDGGVTFCRRVDWEGAGGYNEGRTWGEDVAFLWSLRRRGRARGQRLVRPRGARAIFSTRKFDQHGDWHAIRQSARLVLGLLVHRPTADRLVRRYWYEGRG